MRLSNVEYDVVYVDPSRSTSGDGTTPAKALKSLPSTAGDFLDNTCYIIRRTAETAAALGMRHAVKPLTMGLLSQWMKTQIG